MDKFDQKIIALLQDNARLSTSQLAREVALSRSAVTERIKRLEEQHIIRGYHARITLPGSGVRAYFELVFQLPRCELYVEQIREIPEVQLCYSISGNTDMLIYVETADMARLEAIRHELEQLPNIRMLKTHIILNQMINRRF